ncbi:MAG: hypothetical protein EU539_00790 [Promethearchaeota archaeon]|nr:MAG: hypothetical protein EU539_00790 [Candidatus Lokiarchaeota archaeon]
MITTKSIDLVLNKLMDSKNETIAILEKFILLGIDIVETTEELSAEIEDFDGTYQFHVLDIKYDFYISFNHGQITYFRGVNEDAVSRLFFTRDIIIKLFRKEIGGLEAYMKGYIKLKGSLSSALKIRNFLGLLIRYLTNISKNGK